MADFLLRYPSGRLDVVPAWTLRCTASWWPAWCLVWCTGSDCSSTTVSTGSPIPLISMGDPERTLASYGPTSTLASLQVASRLAYGRCSAWCARDPDPPRLAAGGASG